MRKWLCKMLGCPEPEVVNPLPHAVREKSHELRNDMTGLDGHVLELRRALLRAVDKFDNAITEIRDGGK